MTRTRYVFMGRWNGQYHWESARPIPGDSRSEQITCPVDWFWGKR